MDAVISALELHNVALKTADSRLRLVNLWSSLECLASVVSGNTTMERVVAFSVDLLTWQKIDKVLRYFAISLRLWRKNLGINDDCPFILKGDGYVSPERLVQILASGDCNYIKKHVIEPVASNTLLLFRANQCYDMFKNPKALYSNLEASKTRLIWHLWRIYRARNLIVHEGSNVESLSLLADHLQHYVSWLLSRIIHGLSFGDDWTAFDSWRFWHARGSFVLEMLEKNQKNLTVRDFFSKEYNTER
jgi:hypothetical protein